MQQYELLSIFPGTMAENEVAEATQKIKELVEKQGGSDVSFQDMGKSRLAYPMKHIRYGYFWLYKFNSEAVSVKNIQEKLDLSNMTLRAIIRKYNPKSEARAVNKILSDVAIVSLAEEAKKENIESATSPHEAIQTISREKKSEEPVVPKETKSVDFEDIDKKLNELLESDLTKV